MGNMRTGTEILHPYIFQVKFSEFRSQDSKQSKWKKLVYIALSVLEILAKIGKRG